MLPDIEKIKGIHPGVILKREVKRRGLKNKDLAFLVGTHAQTLSAILKGKRSVTPGLSIKLGMELGVDADYFMLLQASHDVKKAQSLSTDQETPDLKHIRKVLFWDTDFDKIDWEKNSRAVIKRIFERGNSKEIHEIIRFYSLKRIKSELNSIDKSNLPSFSFNIRKYVKDK